LRLGTIVESRFSSSVLGEAIVYFKLACEHRFRALGMVVRLSAQIVGLRGSGTKTCGSVVLKLKIAMSCAIFS
jgi:hypothetical protein